MIKTSLTSAPFYYPHFLAQKAYISILIGSPGHDILRDLNAAEDVYRTRGSQRTLLCLWVKAELELYQGHFQSACSKFEECLSRSLGVHADIPVWCLAALGDPRHKMDTAWNTLLWAMIYLAAVQKKHDLVATFQALRRLADLFVVFNDEETALNLFNTVLEGATNIDIHQLRAECMAGIGDIMSHRRDMVKAKEMWEAAYPLFIRSSQIKDAAAIEVRLVKLSLARENQNDRVQQREVGRNPQVSANKEPSQTLEQLALLSAPYSPPSIVTEGLM